MRRTASALTLFLASATSLLAQEHGAAEGGDVNLLDPKVGLMFWTLIIFIFLLVVLS
ncbi:MAG: hypothetical protein HC937_02105, partial [Aquincola sp.]|nr:hypothetical protein [Aquincola sp.]